MDEDLGYQTAPGGSVFAVPAPEPSPFAVAPRDNTEPFEYSDATKAYFDKLNSYIAGLGSAPYGSFDWAMPKQSYSLARPMFGKVEPQNLSVFGDLDASDPRTKYTSEEEYAPYITKPVEENAIYRFNVPSNKNTSTGSVSVGYNTPVMLIDNRTGQVVSSGVGFDAARQIAEAARNLSATQGNKAEWSIYTGAPGATDPSQFKQVAQETKNKGFLGTVADIVGTALPIAVGFIPGLQGVGAVLASAGAGAAGSALRGQDILKGAVMGGLSAAGGQVLGNALKGTAGLSANAARAIGTGVGSTAGGVVTGQDFGNALLGGIASGGLSYLGGELMKPGTRATTGADTSVNAGEVIDPSAITVTGTRLPSLTAPTVNLGGAKAPAKNAETLNPDEIVVTAGRAPNLTSSTFSIPGLAPLPQDIVDLAAKPTEELPGADDIVVTGTRNPALTSSTFTVPGLTPLPQDIVDLANAPDKDEIVVEAQQDANTGSANVSPDTIVVTAKPDAKTSSSTLTVPGLTPLPQDIVDLANKDTVADDKNKLGVKEALALLGLLGGAGGGGGGAGTVGSGSKFQSIFNQKLPVPGQNGALMVGGLKGPVKGAAGTSSARPVTDWYRFGMGPAMDIPAGTDLSAATSPYAGYGPGTLGEETFRAVSGIPAAPQEQPAGMAHGGSMGYARGSSRESFAVNGPGTGRSDDIPAVLSDGEYVIDAETVALLGDGSSKAGAKKLDQMRVNIRKHKGRNLAKGKFSVNAKAPEKYLSGGRA